MSFQFKILPSLEKILNKLRRNDKTLAIAVRKKMQKIINSDITGIEHFKNLRHDLSNYKRVRIGSFVLVFRFEGNIIIFEDFDHHNKIYKKRF